MAQYPITYKCGHSEVKQLYGPGKDRERIINGAKNQLCPACYKREQTRAAAEWSTTQGLPALTGTEAQVNYAVAVRRQLLEELDRAEPRLRKDLQSSPQFKPAYLPLYEQTLADIRTQTAAAWWLDRKDREIRRVVAEVFQPLVAAQEAADVNPE